MGGGGGGAPTKKLILTEGQQGEHHSACYIGIELGFGVVVFLPMVCTLPAGFFFFLVLLLMKIFDNLTVSVMYIRVPQSI